MKKPLSGAEIKKPAHGGQIRKTEAISDYKTKKYPHKRVWVLHKRPHGADNKKPVLNGRISE
jgi:hypothetical protein